MSLEEHADSDTERVSRPRPPLAGRPKVMVRPQPQVDADLQGKASTLKPQKTLEEKEAEYEAARARIFGLGADPRPEGLYPEEGIRLVGSTPQPTAAAADESQSQRPASGGRLEVKAVMKKPDELLDPDYNRNIRWHIGGPPVGPVNGMPFANGTVNGVGGLPGGSWARPVHVRKAPSGPHLPRELVSQRRMTGCVLEWKGKYGWIQPEEPVQHSKARIHQGKIFVSIIDLVDVVSLEAGTTVEFYLFQDDAGLGAEECTVISGDRAAPAQAAAVIGVGAGDGATQGTYSEAASGTSQITTGAVDLVGYPPGQWNVPL